MLENQWSGRLQRILMVALDGGQKLGKRAEVDICEVT